MPFATSGEAKTFCDIEGQGPTLLIAGAEDRIVTPRTAKGFADLIPGAEYAQIEGAGHSPYFETPERYNEIVSSFLARHAARD